MLDAVDWPTISKDKPEAWLYFYEDFLEVYDNTLRKRPAPTTRRRRSSRPMVRLVDEALARSALRAPARALLRPTSTWPTRRSAPARSCWASSGALPSTVDEDQGAGAVRGAIEAAAKRLIAFEMQLGPFAVAQLAHDRRNAGADEVAEQSHAEDPDLRMFITDTLGNPVCRGGMAAAVYEPIANPGATPTRSRSERADHGRDRQSALQGEGRGPRRLDRGRLRRASCCAARRWMPPPEWGVGAHAKHLQQPLHLFLALGDVEGLRFRLTRDRLPTGRQGIVCFITVAGFLNGPGFQKMRDYLRRDLPTRFG